MWRLQAQEMTLRGTQVWLSVESTGFAGSRKPKWELGLSINRAAVTKDSSRRHYGVDGPEGTSEQERVDLISHPADLRLAGKGLFRSNSSPVTSSNELVCLRRWLRGL